MTFVTRADGVFFEGWAPSGETIALPEGTWFLAGMQGDWDRPGWVFLSFRRDAPLGRPALDADAALEEVERILGAR